MDTKISHFGEGGKILEILDNIEKIPRTPLRLVIFSYDNKKPFVNTLNDLTSGMRKFNYTISYDDDPENTLLKIHPFDEELNDKTEIYLLIYKKKPSAVLITNASSRKFSRVISYFNKLYPFLSRVFFRSTDIKDLLAYIERKGNIEIFVDNYVLKRYYVNKKTDVTTEKITYKEVYEIAAENFQWVDSIHIGIRKKVNEDKIHIGNSKKNRLGSIRINRRGIIQYDLCPYSTVESLFTRSIIEEYKNFYDKYLVDRSRTLQQLEPRPVMFVTEEASFKSSEDTILLKQQIRSSLHDWGYGTLYDQGIHLCLMLHDYKSGSSFEILVASTSEIIITPQTQVTSLSFNALINFFFNLYDGWLEDV